MKLGCMQTLRVIKKVDFGVYLSDIDQPKAEERVLLPKKQVPEQTRIGDEIEVFLYRDSKDRMIAIARQRSGKNRSFFGLGIGKRFVPSL